MVTTNKSTRRRRSQEPAETDRFRFHGEFDRIDAQMRAAFDRVLAETMANLDAIEQMTDFGSMRDTISAQFDKLERAGKEEQTKIRAEHGKPGKDVVRAQVDLAHEVDGLADAAERLSAATFRVRWLAGVLSGMQVVVPQTNE